ncbi:MAG: RNA polymerase sigma factor [Pseudohongiella sp.]
MTDCKALETRLILRALSGADNRAFGRLVVMHQGRVRALLRRLCGNSQMADDLAQDVFVVAWQKLPDYQGRGKFGAWLCSIAYHKYLQTYRQRTRERDIHAQYGAWQTLTLATGSPDDRPGQIDLERAMLNLPPAESAAITLNMTLGYSHQEVATMMQMPLGTVKSHIKRGLEKLKCQLSATPEQGSRNPSQEKSA